MNDRKHIADRINFHIEEMCYYLKYPNGVEPGFWKDGNGNYQSIRDMNLDHLQACIRTIEKHKKWFNNQKVKDHVHNSVCAALFPLMNQKLGGADKRIARAHRGNSAIEDTIT